MFFEAACVAEALPETNKYWKGASDNFKYVSTQVDAHRQRLDALKSDPAIAAALNKTLVLQAVALKACAMSQLRHMRMRRKEVVAYLSAAKDALRTTPPNTAPGGGRGSSGLPTPPEATQTPPEFFLSTNPEAGASPGRVSGAPSPGSHSARDLASKAKAQQKDRDFLTDADEMLKCLENWHEACCKAEKLADSGERIPAMPDMAFVNHWQLHALLKQAGGL